MPRPPPTPPMALARLSASTGEAARRRLRRVFIEGFHALDVAEPLVSFDADRPASAARASMAARGFDLAGVRVDGVVGGYVACAELRGGCCGDHLRPFGPGDVVTEDASLQEVIVSLGVNGRCFVTVLDQPAAIVTHDDLEKPPVRMFLFGMITMLETHIVRQVERRLLDAARGGEPVDLGRVHAGPGLHDEGRPPGVR